MKCRQNSQQLMEYVEGTLKGDVASRLEQHLACCEQCRRELDSWRRLEAALRRFPMVAEPAGLRAAVMARIQRSQPATGPARWRGLEAPVGATFGSVLMSLVGLLILLRDAVDGSTLWRWQHQASLWLEIYVQDAYPNLLVASWLLAGALSVAALGIASGEMMRVGARR